jgi:hypothetical protein
MPEFIQRLSHWRLRPEWRRRSRDAKLIAEVVWTGRYEDMVWRCLAMMDKSPRRLCVQAEEQFCGPWPLPSFKMSLVSILAQR